MGVEQPETIGNSTDCRTVEFVGGVVLGAILVCIGATMLAVAWCAAVVR